MRRDLGHACFTSLRFPGPGGGPWLAAGSVIAQISKLVTREHVVHGLALGRRAMSPRASSQPCAKAASLLGSAWRESERGAPSSSWRRVGGEGGVVPGLWESADANALVRTGADVPMPGTREHLPKVPRGHGGDGDSAYSRPAVRCCVAGPWSATAPSSEEFPDVNQRVCNIGLPGPAASMYCPSTCPQG
jgi:hypothetical protein